MNEVFSFSAEEMTENARYDSGHILDGLAEAMQPDRLKSMSFSDQCVELIMPRLQAMAGSLSRTSIVEPYFTRPLREFITLMEDMLRRGVVECQSVEELGRLLYLIHRGSSGS